SHYYFYGPVFPMLYGTIASIFGWGYGSGPLLNIGLVTVALFVFVLTSPSDVGRLRVGLLVVGTFWPLLLFLPTTMQEGIHLAIGIVLASGFYQLCKQRDSTPRSVKIAVWLIIAVGALMRSTWGMLFLPY